jgi:exonuclease SbcC
MSHTQVEKPHDWLSEYDAERKNLQLQFNQVRQSYDQVRQQFIEQQRQLDQFKTQLAQLEAQQSTANLEIQHWLAQHSDFNLTVLEQLKQISNEQEQHIRQIVQAAERNLTDAQSAVNTLQQQQLQHLVQQPEIDFEQLQQKLNELVQQLKDAQALRDAHNIKLELHQRNLAKQQQFAERIQQIQTEEHRWGKISGLMGDASGKKFRDYAQQYNLDILIEHANQQLALLSQRYTLKRLEHSLSLAIIDHDMDGETRSVASLSGGESFLTALALSLAIANMASGSMKIESLFIDEGFGTLDASSLHMVMNALDQLQNQGRKVVLISHIQEMHERIPVQIQVKPLGAGASTIEIVG